MKAAVAGVNISPVNMDERKTLGIKAGDTVRVHQKIQDKGKTRIQIFEGLVLARKHGTEPGATFTVRKVASGVGVEKIYPLYSPLIDKIEIVKRAKVRRAKLYYIREKVNREIKRQMRRMSLVALATESEAELAVKKAEAAKKAEAEAEAAQEEAKLAAEKAEAEATTTQEQSEETAATQTETVAEETSTEESAPAEESSEAEDTESAEDPEAEEAKKDEPAEAAEKKKD